MNDPNAAGSTPVLKSIDELAHAAVTSPEQLAHEDVVRLGAAWLDQDAHADKVVRMQRRLMGGGTFGPAHRPGGLVGRLGDPPAPALPPQAPAPAPETEHAGDPPDPAPVA